VVVAGWLVHADVAIGWNGGRRSHWVDEQGVDHLGRLVIDADEVDPQDERDDSKVNRRRALIALGGSSAVPRSRCRRRFGPGREALRRHGRTAAGYLQGQFARRRLETAGRTAAEHRADLPGTERQLHGLDRGDKVRKNTPQQGAVLPAPAQAATAAAPQPALDPLSALGSDPVRHLASRLTFGATPKLISDINKMGIDQWIAWQFEPERIPETRPSRSCPN